MRQGGERGARPECSTRRVSTLLFLPLAHVFGRVIEIGSVLHRSELGHTADVRRLPADLPAFRPTFLLAVPRVFEKVYNTARQTAYGGGHGQGLRRGRGDRDRVQPGAATHGRVPPRAAAAARAVRPARLRQAPGRPRRPVHYAAISGGAPLGERLGHFFRGVGITVSRATG